MPKATKVTWPPAEKGFKPAPRPTSVKVGIYEYVVLWIDDKEWRGMDDTDNGHIGDHHGPSARIRIRLVPDCHEQTFRETLWHEIMHAVWYQTDMNGNPVSVEVVGEVDQEETIIARSSYLFLQVLQDNPDVMAYLSAMLYSVKAG
jgi:hypothetical protein